MISKISSKLKLVGAIFGCIFGILGLISPLLASPSVYADEPTTESRSTSGEMTTPSKPQNTTQNTTEEQNTTTEQNTETKEVKTKTCDASLGSLGWLVCPTTGKISEAVDWLYDRIENLLIINPVEIKEESPIYQIWRYFLGISNLAFVIFLLIAIFSQITGVGISNYGIKKILPKLIIAAILVNLSFLICSLAVDVSNIIGDGLRGIFTSIEEATIPDMMAAGGASSADAHMSMARLYTGLSDGTSLATIAGVIAFEGGEIWLLIPAVLGAIVSVVIGLITIALRQVVVILLIMIVPLAVVAYMLPNTEGLFKKWKNLFVKMLVFYPMYSLLFGASSLAGWAIILAANDGFGLILGVVVQIFPLFFSWSLMKMSGTFLGTINAKLTGMFAKPLATNRAWAESHKELTKQRQLASQNVYTPSLRLRQFLNDRKIARELEIKENAETVNLRGAAYATKLNYKKDGSISKEGAETYERMIRNREYQNIIDRSKSDYDKGLGQLEVTKRSKDFAMRRRLDLLDQRAVNAFDEADAISNRAELIDYHNRKSRQERHNDALNAHMDDINGYDLTMNENGQMVRVPRDNYKFHMDRNSTEYKSAIDRYNRLSSIMEGNPQDTQYIMASATNSYDSAKKIYESKMQKLFDYTVPTKDVEHRLEELSKHADALKNIDAIIAGMRILNQRGDTDLVKSQLDAVLSHGVDLGTHVSQALASFLMFEVKDSDPFLRRFGKYINLETARMYNSNDRKASEVTYEEYIKGYHEEPDGTKMYAKKDMNKLVEGTSLDNIERTTFSNLDESLKKAYGFDSKNPSKDWDFEGYLRKREEIQTAIEPAFLSAGLKWLSGSEQINSAAKFWMGYENKMMKSPDGSVLVDENGDPLYETTPVEENDDAFKGNEKYRKKMKEYFTRKTKDWVKDQTTGQILNMRTDFREPVVERLLAEYLNNNKEFQDEYNQNIEEIKAKKYKDDPAENRKAVAKAIASYKRKVARKELTPILGETGKLKTIYDLKHSSATANTKDWMREMIGLDDIEQMRRDVNHYDNLKKAKQEEEGKSDSAMEDDDDDTGPYTKRDRENFVDQMEDLFTQHGHEEDFYDRSLKLLKKILDKDNVVIKKYEEYRKNNPRDDNRTLLHQLKELLRDKTNYN